jgi:hypothetical protein
MRMPEPEPTDSHSPGDVALSFVALNEYLSAGGDRATALRRLVDLAVQTIPGCRWAAVTAWPADRPPRSLAVSHEIARIADQMQYDLGEGPCLDATSHRAPVHVPDLLTDDRWPKLRAAVADRSAVRGVLSLHLAEVPDEAALNLYSDRAGALDREAIPGAVLFATHARVLMIHADSTRRAAELAEALTTSRQIGAAIGVLMQIHKVTSDQAFVLLRETSQRLNRKLRLVAADVTETGELPPYPEP